MQKISTVLQIAVLSPLHRTFDYLPPKNVETNNIKPGMRVRIPFGRTTKIGLVLSNQTNSRIESGKLKRIHEVIDEEPLLGDDVLTLMHWANHYYHHTPGEVFFSALPTLLRKGQAAQLKGQRHWRLTAEGQRIEPGTLTRAPAQAMIMKYLHQHPEGAHAEQLEQIKTPWQTTVRSLVQKGWVRTDETPAPIAGTQSMQQWTATENTHNTNQEQQQAIEQITSSLGQFQPFLLDGVTGSGKTEVYFQVIRQVIEAGQQTLVLVPEIGLTPQLIARFEERFNVPLVVMHSALSDRERLDAWLRAKQGQASIVIGTRSAVFTSLCRPGLIIIDEEHDLSFKQQEGFRYHARDLAIVRAQHASIPIVLGSATPSLETLHNALQGRYQRVVLSERSGEAMQPAIRLLDVRHKKMPHNISDTLLQAIEHHLELDSQVLIFLNRRGYAPTLICYDCGWVATCQRCDSNMVYHQSKRQLRCHHCDAQYPVITQCPTCNSTELHPMGHGTERVEEALQQHFPDTDIVRIDRDSTRRKGALHQLLESVKDGRRQILLGTQMLAKGHHLPNVTLVGILNADYGLYGIDFRASERMGQLIIQVAGRAGRADKKGEVLIQTYHPEHPLLTTLLLHDYHNYAKNLLEERRLSELPPYSKLALLRAESVNKNEPQAFLSAARHLAEQLKHKSIELLGPVAAPMERRAGRYRAQLLIQSSDRAKLHQLLNQWVVQFDQLPKAKKVRWSLDVDPMDML